MARLLPRMVALFIIQGPTLWFGLVAAGLPLPFQAEAGHILTQAGAGVMLWLWTPASAVLAGWLTGRWTDVLLAGAPLPLVRLTALAWFFVFGPPELRGSLSQGPDLYAAWAALGIAMLMTLAADAFWLIAGGLLGATRLVHRPGWEPLRTTFTAMTACGVALVALLLLPALWMGLDAGLELTGLDRAGAAPPALIMALWASTVLPSVALYLGASALSRRPLAVPLGLATACLAAATLFVALLDAQVGLVDALLALTVSGPLIGVFSFAGAMVLGTVGTGVGRMARGERLFGRGREAEEGEAQTSAM